LSTITRRKFIGLAAALVAVPTGLLLSEAAPRSRSNQLGGARAATATKAPVGKSSRNLFIDESGSAADEFRIAGCLAIDAALSKKIKALVRHNLGNEQQLKWNRVSIRNYPAHQKVVAAILDALDRNELQFTYAVAQARNANWLNSQTDIGYSRAVDTLLRRCALEHRSTHKLYIYPQRRRADGSLIALCRNLNRFASNNKFAKAPIRLIEYRDSRDSLLNQVVDVLVGALAYRANARLADSAANSEKQRLADYIAKRISPSSRVAV